MRQLGASQAADRMVAPTWVVALMFWGCGHYCSLGQAAEGVASSEPATVDLTHLVRATASGGRTVSSSGVMTGCTSYRQ